MGPNTRVLHEFSAVSEDLHSLRLCAWTVASVNSAELLEVSRRAAHHTGSAVIASCQRVEVLHRDKCSCEAPVQRAEFDALLRVAEVAAGLDSVVLGEPQVLGQVRSGLASAPEPLARLGAMAIAAARELRAESTFEGHTGHLLDRALAAAGVQAGGRIAVVGAGAAGRLIAERAIERRFDEIVVVARRLPEGAWFDAGRMRYVALDTLVTAGPIDVLVTALGSSARPLGASDLPEVRAMAADLGTPRNLPDGLPFPVITIAALLDESRLAGAEAERRAVLTGRLRAILGRRVDFAARDSRSSIGRLRLELERMRATEAHRIARLHPEIPETTVETITRSLVNRLFHGATERLRSTPDPAFARQIVELFVQEERL
jgi:glutamyl-tRNA reductase